MLDVEGVNVHYGDFHVIHDVSLQVREGEAVGLVGANGHGKSTLLRAICGLLPITSGEIRFAGERIDGLTTPQRVEQGLVYVAEDRHLFADMSVRENLVLGAFGARARPEQDENLALVFDLYPRLKERQDQYARTLSGGEAQMLALGRGLMSAGRFVAIDEPSLGLAPNLVESMLETIRHINDRGITVLLVEQNLDIIEPYIDRVYVLEEGSITREIPATATSPTSQADTEKPS